MGGKVLAERLQRRGELGGLTVEYETARRLAGYVELLLAWNGRMNLTALDAGDAGLDRLAIEPLAAAERIGAEARAAIDIGSGGGSPAIPVKIGRPDLFLRMVECRSRKAAFLREAVRRLGLQSTVVENCRYEALRDRADVQEGHDVLLVRGIRVDESVAEDLQRFVRPGGRLVIFCSAAQTGIGSGVRGPLRVERRERLLRSTTSEVVVWRKESELAARGPSGGGRLAESWADDG